MAKLTLPDFAGQKGFTAGQLAAYGVRATKAGSIIIPYYDQAGNEYIRYRIRSSADDGKGFAWSKGDAPLLPYGLHHPVPPNKGALWIVEGESDCWAMWSAGIAALGVPGASNAGCLRASHLAGAQTVLVVQEPGQAGERFPHLVAQKLYDDGFPGNVYAVTLDQKDPRALLLASGDAFREKLQEAYKGRRAIARPQMVAAAPVSKTLSAAEFLARGDDEVEWLVEGLLPSGGIALLSAKPKAGKSVFARNLALAVARGSSFLGRRCTGGAVLWVALEEPKATLATSFRAMGLQGQDPIRFHLGSAPAEAYRWLESECATHRISLIVLDTWHKLTLIEKINDYGMVNRANEPLMRLARDKGIAQVWIHHSNKSDHTNGDQVLGSSALYAAADTLIDLRRGNDGVRTVRTIQRVGDDLEETVVGMDLETQRIETTGSRYVVAVERTRELVLQYLAQCGQPPTKTELLAAVEGRTLIVRAALGALLEFGWVETLGSGKSADPKRYRLTDKASFRHQNTLSSQHKEIRSVSQAARARARARDTLDAPLADQADLPGPTGTYPDQADQADQADLLLRYAETTVGGVGEA